MPDESLIEALDPDRDYGDRTFPEVVSAVQSGSLALSPGQSVPVIRDTRTGLTVRGTGQPLGKGAHAAFSRAYIQEKFANNAQAIWDAAFKYGVEEGDPRWAKLLFEFGIGAPLQDKGNEAGATEFMKVLAALAEKSRAVPMEEVPYVDERA